MGVAEALGAALRRLPASRVVVLFAALASQWLVPRIHPWRLLGTGWDGSWYTKIAQYGYPHHIFNEDDGSRWAFLPGVPGGHPGHPRASRG